MKTALKEFVMDKTAMVERFRGDGKPDITINLSDFGGQEVRGTNWD